MINCLILKIVVGPLVYFYNFILEIVEFPEDLKTAVLVPVFKHSNKTDMHCYRPVSLLLVFAKIFEKIKE